jgi:hypothetical protein
LVVVVMVVVVMRVMVVVVVTSKVQACKTKAQKSRATGMTAATDKEALSEKCALQYSQARPLFVEQILASGRFRFLTASDSTYRNTHKHRITSEEKSLARKREDGRMWGSWDM